MSLFSNLLKTYNFCSAATGISKSGKDGIIDERKALLPLFHTTLPTEINVFLDNEGNLISVTRDAIQQHIIIPCTEQSASRSGKVIAPHPLCDQVGYIDKNLDSTKYTAYLAQLNSWKQDNIKLNAIFNYLSKNSIVLSIVEFNLLKDSEKDNQGNVVYEKIAKLSVRFTVEVLDDKYSNIWEDIQIREQWINHLSSKVFAGEKSFDYLSGKEISFTARTHPKNINSFTANAKLLSCNDSSGFTFRGRFSTQNEAIQIDSYSSQKAHHVLKWLINNFSSRIDTQATIIWAVGEDAGKVIQPYKNSWYLFFNDIESEKTSGELLQEANLALDQNYSKMVAMALKGYGSESRLKEHDKKVVIAIFDAATSGRMGILFYQELAKDEYLENIANWHEDSAWHLVGFKKEEDEKGKEFNKRFNYIGCPSFDDITKAVYGKPRGGNDKGYSVIKKKMQKQLLECMFGNFAFPENLVNMAAFRASNPMSFTNDKGSFAQRDWLDCINTTCSLMKKHIKQKKKEEISLELERDRRDRDYLYGRLLSVAHRIEETAYWAGGKDVRATNAVRLMNSFSTKPNATWFVLRNQLQPYINQLNGAGYLQSLIDSIMVLFKEGDYEDNKPLSPLYLLGFSAQNFDFRRKNNKSEDKKEDDNTTKED